MAIDINAGFKVGSTSSPIDNRLVLSKKQMYETDDKDMPSTYFCVCKDDTCLYVYNKQFIKNSLTGKFRLATIEGAASTVDIDLSSYATIQQLNEALDTKADKDELHEHNNKVLLDALSLDSNGMLCIDGKALVTILDTIVPDSKHLVESRAIYDFVHTFETTGYNVLASTSLPTNSCFGKAFLYNGSLYLICGYESNSIDSTAASTAILVYNSASESWTKFYDLPIAFDKASADVMNGYLYIAFSNKTFYELNLSTKQLYRYCDLPAELSYMGLSAYKNELYLMGGYYYDGTNYVTSNKVYKFNKTINYWQELSVTMPVSSANFGICSDDNFIFILGGWHLDYDSIQKHCGFYRFDGTKFEQLEDCPVNTSDVPNTAPSIYVYNRRVHAIGGLDSTESSYNKHYAYVDQRWLPVESDASSYAQGQAVCADGQSMYVLGGRAVEDNVTSELLDTFFIYTEHQTSFNFDVLDGLNIDEDRRLYFENDKLAVVNKDSADILDIQKIASAYFNLADL